jgi:BlaI family penicillinase repressor
MKTMTSKEEEIMQVIWRLKKAFVKEIIEELPEPKPHYNTVSTLVRNLEEKELLLYDAFGNSHRYYAAISQDSYRKVKLKDLMTNYFDNSFKNLVTFFANEESISKEELAELSELINKDLDKNQ